MNKGLILIQLIVLFTTILVSLCFYETVAFWPTAASIGFTLVSTINIFTQNKFLNTSNSVAYIYQAVISRLFLTLMLLTVFRYLRNVTEVWFIVSIFSVYLSSILFELKYIIHNLRPNSEGQSFYEQ